MLLSLIRRFSPDTNNGRVDLAQNTISLINKVRPLVHNNGRIVFINNALFLSGVELTETLQTLCEGGWVAIEERVPISADFTGYPQHHHHPTHH